MDSCIFTVGELNPVPGICAIVADMQHGIIIDHQSVFNVGGAHTIKRFGNGVVPYFDLIGWRGAAAVTYICKQHAIRAIAATVGVNSIVLYKYADRIDGSAGPAVDPDAFLAIGDDVFAHINIVVAGRL